VKGTSNVQHGHYNDGAPTTGTKMSSTDHTYQAERSKEDIMTSKLERDGDDLERNL